MALIAAVTKVPPGSRDSSTIIRASTWSERYVDKGKHRVAWLDGWGPGRDRVQSETRPGRI